jgi:hypothetical protein
MTNDEKHVVRQILREKQIGADEQLMEALYKKHAALFRRAALGDCGAMNEIRLQEGLKEYQSQ